MSSPRLVPEGGTSWPRPGWSQLSSLDVEHGRLGLASEILDESIPFTVRRDIPICRHWQTAVRARVHLGHGEWDSALFDADDVIRTDGMEVARLWPYLISGSCPYAAETMPRSKPAGSCVATG